MGIAPSGNSDGISSEDRRVLAEAGERMITMDISACTMDTVVDDYSAS